MPTWVREEARVNLATSDAKDRPEPRCQAVPRPARLGSERAEEPGGPAMLIGAGTTADRVAAATPGERDRFADLLRVASILVVVAGH